MIVIEPSVHHWCSNIINADKMQTILGSGGTIGTELAGILTDYTKDIRLVSRNPEKVNETDQVYAADLTNAGETMKAVEGSEVAYLTVGLPYKTRVWEKAWPLIMGNVLKACREHGTRLVFFDNMYMYDAGSLSLMTEDNPVNPPSEKGKVRAEIAGMLMDEVEKGNVKALIARSADFYGPDIGGSILMEGVYSKLKQGEKANWFCSLDYQHSFTWTPDAAKGTAILGNDPDAFDQIWHLPTAADPPAGKEWIRRFAEALEQKPKSMVAGKTVVWLMGLFNPLMRELAEMLYQYDRDYVFDSSKFNKKYGYQPVSWEEGIRRIVEHP